MTFRRKPWKKPPPLVPKVLGESVVDKGPARDSAFLARIRGLPCLICVPGQQTAPTEAHHPKGLFPRTMGKRISDHTCCPLCRWHHQDGPDALHKTGDEAGWWERMGVDPLAFIRSSREGREALALFERKAA